MDDMNEPTYIYANSLAELREKMKAVKKNTTMVVKRKSLKDCEPEHIYSPSPTRSYHRNKK
jgi:hypothetical protein